MTKQQEFLEILANPVRLKIRKGIQLFRESLQYYAWEIIRVDTYERNGCHDICVIVCVPDLFPDIRRTLHGLFPSSPAYVLRSSEIETICTAPDGDQAWQQNFSIVESHLLND